MQTSMNVEQILDICNDPNVDVYAMLGDDVGDTFVVSGHRVDSSVWLTVEPAAGGRRRVVPNPTEQYAVRVYR